MGVTIPVDFAQVSATFSLTGDVQPMVVTIGCDPGVFTDPVDLADSVFARFIASGTIFAASSYSDQYRIGPFSATIMTASGPQTADGTDSQQGTNAGILPPPNNVAILVQKRTAFGGRRGRGRMYFPPLYPTENSISAIGDLTGVTFDAWQEAMDEFLEAMSVGGTPMYLLHSDVPTVLLPSVVTALQVQQKVATQRTRLRR